jgi:hypothetical protein
VVLVVDAATRKDASDTALRTARTGACKWEINDDFCPEPYLAAGIAEDVTEKGKT